MSIRGEEKDPDVPRTYPIVWDALLVQEAFREYQFSTGALVRPESGTGFYYQGTPLGGKAYGITSAHTPRWPRASGESVQDGSILWTAVYPADAAIPQVSTAVWTVPAGITKDSQSETGIVTYITLSGGTHGEDYEVTCRMTPTVGNPIEQTIVVPVRSQ